MKQKCLYMPKSDGIEETVSHCRYKSKYLCDGCSLPLCQSHTRVRLVNLNDYRAYDNQIYGSLTPFRLYLCQDCNSTKHTVDIIQVINL
jgi:hypothetical protein